MIQEEPQDEREREIQVGLKFKTFGKESQAKQTVETLIYEMKVKGFPVELIGAREIPTTGHALTMGKPLVDQREQSDGFELNRRRD